MNNRRTGTIKYQNLWRQPPFLNTILATKKSEEDGVYFICLFTVLLIMVYAWYIKFYHLKICDTATTSELNLKSSYSQMFYKMGVLINFAKFIGKHLRQSLFSIKLQTVWLATLIKIDSSAAAFSLILQNFSEQHFPRTPPGNCF